MNVTYQHRSFKRLVGIWQIIVVLLLAGGAGYLAYSQYDKIPNQYEANATLEVVTKAKITANSQALDTSIKYVQVVKDLILTNSYVANSIASKNIAVINGIKNNLQLESNDESSVINVSYKARAKKDAVKIVNQIVAHVNKLKLAKGSKIVVQSRPQTTYTYSTKLSKRLITVMAVMAVIIAYLVIVIFTDMWERARVL